MTEKEIIRNIMKENRWSLNTLAKETGYKSGNNVSGFLNRGNASIRTDLFVKLVKAMGYEVVVRPKYDNSKASFTLDFEGWSKEDNPKAYKKAKVEE